MKFPHYYQLNSMDCGPTCLRIVAKYYGKDSDIEFLRKNCGFAKDGVSLFGICQAAEIIGFETTCAKISIKDLIEGGTLPAILHWNQDHFIVLHKIKKSYFPNSTEGYLFSISDPAAGLIELSFSDFKKSWLNTAENNGSDTGIIVFLEPTPNFHELKAETKRQLGWHRLFKYLVDYRKYFFRVFLLVAIVNLIQVAFPVLTKTLVDKGLNKRNLPLIYMVLLAQLVLSTSRTFAEFFRSRILLFISTRINLSIISDFWKKMMSLPLSYFDTRQVGDTLQRLNDNKLIEQFLTSATISTLFSLISFVVFSLLLLSYSTIVFLIFVVGSILYFFWIRLFMSFRRRLNYKQFSIASKENSATMQLVYGMQDIKLNNAEYFYRNRWEDLQKVLFELSFKSLSLNQYQQAGALFINEGKNILITFLVSKLVLDGHLSLGTMFSVQYIIGQLNSPIEQMISFLQSAQDAKISLERLNEIYLLNDETQLSSVREGNDSIQNKNVIQGAISINDLSFVYPGAGNQPVLKNINLIIPEGKITAIVGTSGSGKTTVLKLLLKFYEDYSGEIRIQGNDLKYVDPKDWRNLCGFVMQNGYIFSDTIINNIAVGEETPDIERVKYACRIANINEFIENLPMGLQTKIGAEGNGISRGQEQRLIIARAVYKNPKYLFFDEATNSLDANNERVIVMNLQDFFEGKTVVVVAHRLSTVKNADKIVVLEDGQVVEAGNHDSLTRLKGKYYELIKNQLELGT